MHLRLFIQQKLLGQVMTDQMGASCRRPMKALLLYSTLAVLMVALFVEVAALGVPSEQNRTNGFRDFPTDNTCCMPPCLAPAASSIAWPAHARFARNLRDLVQACQLDLSWQGVRIPSTIS